MLQTSQDQINNAKRRRGFVDFMYAVFLNNKLFLQILPELEGYSEDHSELAGWLLDAVQKCIYSLEVESYNAFVSNNLPYQKRIGKIQRDYYWSIFPKVKERLAASLSDSSYSRSVEIIKLNLMLADNGLPIFCIMARSCGDGCKPGLYQHSSGG